MLGILGGMFDFDGNGTLDVFEQAAEFAFLSEAFEEEKTELELSGLDPLELEYMSAYERRMTLEEAGLNPDDYDF